MIILICDDKMKVGIFGCGAFGLALANILVNNKIDVTIWTRKEETKNKYLQDVYPAKITNSIEECVNNKDLLIIAIPVAYIRDLCIKMKNNINSNTNICIVSKGIEQKTGLFPYDIANSILKINNIAVLSGPSFAKDIMNKNPIGFTLASKIKRPKDICLKVFSNDYIKIETTEDIIGTQICGAIKNVIAIASGMLDGLNAGDSTRAMLITEAVYDLEEILSAFNGDKKTVLSYAGFGDLLLTCTSSNSRNYSFGKLIGEGLNSKDMDEYLINNTVEGYYTLESIYNLLKNKDVKIPIINIVYNIVNNGGNPNDLLLFLVKNK